MFVEERHAEILLKLKKKGKVLVKELSRDFNVTEDCIRKDLAALEKQGLLKRAYGGAVENRVNLHMAKVERRRDIDVAEKKKIAEMAVSFIEENEMVFLDISTINLEIAHILLKEPKKGVTIVTNMVGILNIAAEKQTLLPFIFIGGELNAEGDGFFGALTAEMLSRFRFDRAFMGVVGIDVYTNSAYTYSTTDGLTKNTIMERSRISHLVAENRKFTQDGNYQFAKLERFANIITDKALPKEEMEKLSDLGTTLVF